MRQRCRCASSPPSRASTALVQAGDTVYIPGGGGGIGHYVFDYKRDDIAAEISKLTGGRGTDLVFVWLAMRNPAFVAGRSGTTVDLLQFALELRSF